MKRTTPLVVCVTAALAGALTLVSASQASAAISESFTTPGCTTWVVPAGVSSVDIVATGSAGQSIVAPGNPTAGGAGAVMSGTLSGLTVGQSLRVCVNSGGGLGGAGAPGYVNGGAGGGASGVSLGTTFGVPVLVAAGGGGAANGAGSPGFSYGGAAGLPNGSPGGAGPFTSYGGGATQGTPGAAGPAEQICTGTCGAGVAGGAFNSNGPGVGGTGGAGVIYNGGGGGGAGYAGGGGGGGGLAGPGGGGGGSDFCAATLPGATLTSCAVTGSNANFGTASVSLTYTAAAGQCNGVNATRVGTSGDDVIVGTEGNDVIAAGAGDDKVLGLGGDDIICGGDGKDRLKGGAGVDRLLGEAGKDFLVGGPGRPDVCNGGPGKDGARGCEKPKKL